MISAPDLARMQQLWEDSLELSAAMIAERFGVTKNVVIGRATRGQWKRRGPSRPPSTIFSRLDAIHARMDQVLAEAAAAVERDRQKRAAAEARKVAA
jgi:hypothetical protein